MSLSWRVGQLHIAPLFKSFVLLGLLLGVVEWAQAQHRLAPERSFSHLRLHLHQFHSPDHAVPTTRQGIKTLFLGPSDHIEGHFDEDDCFVFGQDKIVHMGLTFGATMSMHYFLEKGLSIPKPLALFLTVSTVTAIGLGKEYYDWKELNKPFCAADIMANSAGILSASLLILSL